jgi:hypothetical protein
MCRGSAADWPRRKTYAASAWRMYAFRSMVPGSEANAPRSARVPGPDAVAVGHVADLIDAGVLVTAGIRVVTGEK